MLSIRRVNAFYYTSSFRDRLPSLSLNIKAHFDSERDPKSIRKLFNCLSTKRFDLKYLTLHLYACDVMHNTLRPYIKVLRSKILNTKYLHLKYDTCPIIHGLFIEELGKALFTRRFDLIKLQISVINRFISKSRET